MKEINAKQAKKMANEQVMNEVKAVFQMIKGNASRGKYEVEIKSKLQNYVVDKLKFKGYKVVAYSVPENGVFHKVSWN